MPTYATVFGPVPFTTADALRVGLARAALRGLVARGQVRRLVRGVFVDRAVGDSLEVRARALSLATPRGSVVCGRTAAWLWGVDALAMGAHRVLPSVEMRRAIPRPVARGSSAAPARCPTATSSRSSGSW